MSPELRQQPNDEAARLRAELERMRARFETLLEAAPVMSLVFDAAGVLLGANDRWLKNMGYRLDEVLGRPLQDFMSPGSRAVFTARLLPQLARDGALRGEECSLVRRMGEPLEVLLSAATDRSADGGFERAHALVVDISPLRQTQRLLRDREAWLRDALAGARMGTWMWELGPGPITWSDQVAPLFGLKPGEFSGKFDDFAQLIHPDDRERVLPRIASVALGEADAFLLEHRVLWPDGSCHWVECRGRLTRNPEGRPERLSGTVMDVTERKVAEEARARSEARLSQAQHIARLGIWEWDVPTDATTWSGEMFKIYGIKEEEFTGRGSDYLAFTHPEDRAGQQANIKLWFDRAAAQARRHPGNAAEFQAGGDPQSFRVVRPDGSVCHVMGDAVAVVDDQGRPLRMLGTLLDVTATKSAEAALRASEERFRKVFEESPMGMVIVGMDFKSLKVNRVICEMLGYSEAELMDKTFAEYTHPEDVEWEMAEAVKMVRGEIGAVAIEKRYIRKDGSVVWARLNVGILHDESGRPYCGIAMVEDVTRSKRTHQALRESEERLRVVMQHTPAIIYMCDRDGRILFINRVNPGWNLDEVMGSDSFQYDDPRYHEAKRAALRQVFDEGESKLLEMESVGVPGEWRWYESRFAPLGTRGAVTAALVVCTDVTDRKRAEAALRESEERFRQFANNIQDVIWMVDASRSRVLYVNPAFERVWRVPASELYADIGNFYKYVHPDDREQTRRFFSRSARNAQSAFEYRIVRPDGSVRWIRDRAFRIAMPGRPECVAGIAEDITEARGIEAQLLQAAKVESIGRLAGGVAHDFNNILTSILGFAELLRETLPESSPAYAHAGRIAESSERGAALTRQLLAFARKETIKPATVNLNGLLERVAAMLRRLIGDNIDLATRTDPHLGSVRVDPSQFEQVLINLAVNARDAMPDGGRLLLETANSELDAAFAAGLDGVAPGRYVLLAVHDSGAGMAPEVLQRVFEPFFTTKPVGKGTGLGLAMCYGIVKQNGGHIAVQSEPGRGTTFRIYLPRYDGSSHMLDAVNAGPAQASGGSETILLVEDDPIIRLLAAEVLSRQGYHVLQAENGAVAIELAHAYTPRIDLLVTDVVMPKLGGRELAERLTAERPGLRVLYSSGYTEDTILREGVLTRGMPFLQKPYTPQGLMQHVREVLDAPALKA